MTATEATLALLLPLGKAGWSLASGWAGTLYDLTARRHAAWLASLPHPQAARERLAGIVRRHALPGPHRGT